ncbi:hypothetical protein EDB84DRAFT_1516880 [Lactarius hengduanensis]|nr:hypothetical protein EDB84DRAFT_1516880 [Lactarius hengduanensis]
MSGLLFIFNCQCCIVDLCASGQTSAESVNNLNGIGALRCETAVMDLLEHDDVWANEIGLHRGLSRPLDTSSTLMHSSCSSVPASKTSTTPISLTLATASPRTASRSPSGPLASSTLAQDDRRGREGEGREAQAPW